MKKRTNSLYLFTHKQKTVKIQLLKEKKTRFLKIDTESKRISFLWNRRKWSKEKFHIQSYLCILQFIILPQFCLLSSENPKKEKRNIKIPYTGRNLRYSNSTKNKSSEIKHPQQRTKKYLICMI